MSATSEAKNQISGDTYFISVIPLKKTVYLESLPVALLRASGLKGKIKLETSEYEPWTVFLQAAVFKNPRRFKPLFIINLSSYPRISDKEFAELVSKIGTSENIEQVMEGDRDIFKKYGFLARTQDLRSIYFFKKIRHIFLINAN